MNKMIFTDNEGMYEYLRRTAEEKGWETVLRCLPFMREKHRGQFRDGKERLPYEAHPLAVCLHALLLGVEDEETLSVCLLHDVVEDCGVSPEELPVSGHARRCVQLLSWPAEDHDSCRAEYYAGIMADKTACLVKCLDRCNNLTGMFGAYAPQRMATYARNTAAFLCPLLDRLGSDYGEERLALLLRYQIGGLLSAAESFTEPAERR